MLTKLPEIEVPAEEPFKFDALEREPAVTAFTNILTSLEAPFVLALDSPWGTGKTTFLRFCQARLRAGGFGCVSLNAWNTDFATDPLVALLGELDDYCRQAKGGTALNEGLRKAKRLATIVARQAIPAAAKMATLGALNLEGLTQEILTEFAGGSVSDCVDNYLAEKEINDKFRESLRESIVTLATQMESPKKIIFIFVDELDRCRPSYAVQVLERIKHFFNTPNIIFVLAVDRLQLDVSLQAVYGTGLDASEYLRRFIDIYYKLPEAASEKFTKNIFSRSGMEGFFAQRASPGMRGESEALSKTFTQLADLFELSLRAREQCLTMLTMALKATPTERHFIYPHLLALMVVLRARENKLYYDLIQGLIPPSDVVKLIESKKNGHQFLESYLGETVEVGLINGGKGVEEYRKIANDTSLSPKTRERAMSVLRRIEQANFGHSDALMPSFETLEKRLELAARFQRNAD